MSSNWQDALEELKAYIDTHENDIRIKSDSISIAENVKADFYVLFDKTREALVGAYASQQMSEASMLSENFMATEQELCGKKSGRTKAGWWPFKSGPGKLEEIILEKSLEEFLHQPVVLLRRAVYDSLFSLLQGNLTAEALEKTARAKIDKLFNRYYFQGYAMWIGFNLVSQLQPDHYFNTGIKSISSSLMVKKKMTGAPLVETLPATEETRILDMNRRPEELRTVIPVDILAHSPLLKQYAGIKFGLETPNFAASSANEERASIAYDKARALLGHNSILIYLSANMEPASLVADVARFWPPDMIIDMGNEYNWDDDAELLKIRQRNLDLKPRLGTFIAVKDGQAKPRIQSAADGVSILDIDFDPLGLKPVINKLLSQPPAQKQQ